MKQTSLMNFQQGLPIILSVRHETSAWIEGYQQFQMNIPNLCRNSDPKIQGISKEAYSTAKKNFDDWLAYYSPETKFHNPITDRESYIIGYGNINFVTRMC